MSQPTRHEIPSSDVSESSSRSDGGGSNNDDGRSRRNSVPRPQANRAGSKRKKTVNVAKKSTSRNPNDPKRKTPKKAGNASTSRRNKNPQPTRYRPPSKALQEIRKLQATTHWLIPRLPFQRLVREITYRITNSTDVRYQGAAISALHEATEMYLVNLLEESYLLTLHAKRVTLMQRDLQLAIRIRGRHGLL